jgi:hypothetical protein
VTTDSAKFIEQTTVDSLVTLALNTVDKPESFASDPARSIEGMIELCGDEVVEKALTRCRELANANPRDFTAKAAVQFLEQTLSG